MHQHYIETIIHAPNSQIGMDLLIISTQNEQQADFWERRLPSILKAGAIVLGVAEDWPQKAGTGLGTLYAIKQAKQKLAERYGLDLFAFLKAGKSVGLYHAAGEGKRLSPLALSELNYKTVKLPGRRSPDNPDDFLTTLEAAVKHSAIYANLLKGRITTFWGSQVVIPEIGLTADQNAAILLFTKHLPQIHFQGWKEMQLDNYGLVVVDRFYQYFLIENTTYEYLRGLGSAQIFQWQKGLDVSMGTFSLSAGIASFLLQEFEPELSEKTIKMDTDAPFWMALTMDENSYLSLMQQREPSLEKIKLHYQRMSQFKNRFLFKHPGVDIFSPMDLGKRAYWWDFSSVSSYYHNNIKLLDGTAESQALRAFYLIDPSMFTADGSCLVNCRIDSYQGVKSLLAGVEADSVEAKNSLLVEVHAPRIECADSLLYHVNDCRPIASSQKEVSADVAFSALSPAVRMRTQLNRDGKKDWNARLDSNPYSYEEIMRLYETKREKDD